MGCATVIITNDDSADTKNFSHSQFHHIWGLSYVEQSPPVDLESKCPKGWQSFKTGMGVWPSVVRTLVGGAYDPEEFSYNCMTQRSTASEKQTKN